MGALKEEYLPHYTYGDYIQWEGDWELISGTAYAMALSSMFNHQSISSLLIQSIGNSLKNCMVVSEMDYKIADDTIVRPDISLVCDRERVHISKKAQN